MTTIDTFNRKECDKIDALDVNAYFEFEIDPENPSVLILHTSWGDIKVDLSSVVKLNETITHLKLSPNDNPTDLDYQNETGTHECIEGENLAKIIPLKELKDMSPDNDWRTGYAPVWDATANKFIARYVSTEGSMDSRVTALENDMAIVKQTVNNLRDTVANLDTAITTANANISTLQGQVSALEALTTKPEGIDSSSTLTWSNANVYTNTDKSTGAYVHDPDETVTGDRIINSDVS